MDVVRAEIHGPGFDDLPLLKRLGCLAEIVSHRTVIYAPNADVLGEVIEHFPIVPGAA